MVANLMPTPLMPTRDWYAGRRVFVTGHTGFKGAWLCLWLQRLGAEVTGFALPPEGPSLFDSAGVGAAMRSITGDVRDRAALERALRAAGPEIIIHMAAQSLVRRSHEAPAETFATNVMGTVNLLDAARSLPDLRAVINVTSDKCYENDGAGRPFTETDPMGGADPYSASKGAAEIAASGMARSFYSGAGGAAGSPAHVASVRAGNVIGGGDWAADRIIPDLMRAAAAGRPALIRRPQAVRPWQHVLEPLRGYLMLAQRLATGGPVQGGPVQGGPVQIGPVQIGPVQSGSDFAGGWNFGPDPASTVTVREIAEAVARRWPVLRVEYAQNPEGPHEAPLLALDSGKAAARLGWHPLLTLEDSLRLTTDWYRQVLESGAFENAELAPQLTAGQILEFETRLAAGTE